MVLQEHRCTQQKHIHHILPLLPVPSKLLPPLLLLPLPSLPLLLLLSVSALLAQSLRTPVPAVFPTDRLQQQQLLVPALPLMSLTRIFQSSRLLLSSQLPFRRLVSSQPLLL
jgi:hypothetical protein